MSTLIAVDIDDVVADTLPAFLRYYNQANNTSYSSTDFLSSDWAECLSLDLPAIDLAIRKFIDSKFYDLLNPVNDAFSVLSTLSTNRQIHAVTSRWGALRETTADWIERHMPNVFVEVHYSRACHSNSLENTGATKAEICKTIGASIIVEDCPKHAKACLNKSIEVILFERPWNKEFRVDGLLRGRNWKEIQFLLNERLV